MFGQTERFMINTLPEQILENVTGLPQEMQQEALDFVKMLKRQMPHNNSPPHKKSANGEQIAEIMTQIANRGTAFKQIDPIAWQQEVRKDRPLPDRE